MKPMPKVVQITSDEEGLFALTETGQIFSMEARGCWVEIQTNWCTPEEIREVQMKKREAAVELPRK